MTVEIEADSVNKAFELKKRWAEMCATLDQKAETRRSGSGYSGGGSNGPTKKQWLFMIDLAVQAGAKEDKAASMVWSTATEAGVESLKTAGQDGIDKVIKALKAKKVDNTSTAPLFDSSDTKELVEDDPFD